MQADELLKNAQIRIQIIYYASIYEAKIHYVLFDLFPTNPLVLKFYATKTYKWISVSGYSGIKFHRIIQKPICFV